MKKRLAITIILVLLASAGLVAAHLLTSSNGQDVKISETTLAGSFDAAKGVQVTTEVQTDYTEPYMIWTTKTLLDQEIQVESQMRQDKRLSGEYHRFSMDVLLTSGMSTYSGRYENDEENYFSYIPSTIITSLDKQTEAGETNEVTFNLHDYLDETQMDYVIDSYDPNRNNVHELDIMEGDENYFRNCFTVDVPDEYLVTVSVTKNDNGEINKICHQTDQLTSTSHAARVTDENLYLAINGYTYDGQFFPLKDQTYSGILQIPLHLRQMQVREMKKIYSLPAGVFIEDLRLSQDGSALLLLTTENHAAYLSVIDKATMTQKQKIRLPFESYPGEDSIVTVNVRENSYSAVHYDGGYVVLSSQGGTYEHVASGQFQWKAPNDQYSDLSFLDSSFTLSSDGQTVVASALVFNKDFNITPSYCVQVRNKKELLYYGFFDSSLSDDLEHRQISDCSIDISFVH